MAEIGLSEADIKQIKEWAAKHVKIKRVYLYGSRARGDHRPGSDIDLAVVMGFQEWFRWHSDYKENRDLRLSAKVHLEWYQPNADLERVGRGVEENGVLLYSSS